MHDVEHHTSCYLRNLLNTRAHHDPDVTTFLTLWNFEEHWHGEALGRVLAAHGEAAGSAPGGGDAAPPGVADHGQLARLDGVLGGDPRRPPIS